MSLLKTTPHVSIARSTSVFPLLLFKRISDVYDEEYARFPQNYRFQIPEDCHWNDVRAVATNVGQALQKAMRGIGTASPDTLYGIFGDAAWTNKERLPDALLRDLIEHFSGIALSNKAAQIRHFRSKSGETKCGQATHMVGTSPACRQPRAATMHGFST